MTHTYKQTDVGMIPADWEVKKLLQIAPLQRGFDIPTRNIVPGDYPIVHSNGIIYYHSKALIKAPGIVTGRSGTIGKVHYIDRDFWPHNTTLWVTNFYNNDPKFIYYLYCFLHFEQFTSGSGVPTLNRNDAHLHQVAIPVNFNEQRAIATALSDVDALIGALEALIAKKRAIKQATMQQLLTGQTRLPGFSGAWEVKRLGEIGSTYNGLTGKTKENFGVGSGYYVTFMNVISNVTIKSNLFEKVQISINESQNRVTKGDLLLNGSSETPDEVAMCALMTEDIPNLYLNSFCFGFRIRQELDNVDGLFLTYYLRSTPGREIIKSLAQGSTRYNLSKSAFLDATVTLPPLPEQTAIAAVLSDMDAELAALEAQLHKTRTIKQGMMQELLTGKTRLIVN